VVLFGTFGHFFNFSSKYNLVILGVFVTVSAGSIWSHLLNIKGGVRLNRHLAILSDAIFMDRVNTSNLKIVKSFDAGPLNLTSRGPGGGHSGQDCSCKSKIIQVNQTM
jgi:hypothetical protein